MNQPAARCVLDANLSVSALTSDSATGVMALTLAPPLSAVSACSRGLERDSGECSATQQPNVYTVVGWVKELQARVLT